MFQIKKKSFEFTKRAKVRPKKLINIDINIDNIHYHLLVRNQNVYNYTYSIVGIEKN